MIKIIKLKKDFIPHLSKLHKEIFPTDTITKEDSLKWITGNFNAYPRFKYYVAIKEKIIVGYILWMEKGGFRKKAVLELEQIGITESMRGKGVGTKLIKESIKDIINNFLVPNNRKLHIIEITTSTDNKAQKLYKKTLNAKAECVIKDLYEGDELLMISKDFKIDS